MELGDKVIAYTHEANDLGPDVVRDELAFVTGMVDEEGKCIDVVIFPPKGPVKFERLCLYDPDYLYTMAGGRYFRPDGAAPDFDNTMPYSHDPQWGALVAKQINERDRAMTSAEKDALVDRHTREQKEFGEKHAKRGETLNEKESRR